MGYEKFGNRPGYPGKRKGYGMKHLWKWFGLAAVIGAAQAVADHYWGGR